MSAAGAFPWQRLMHWGLREQRMAPHEFWRSTLRELLPRNHVPPGAVLRQKLDEMMKEFPDDRH